MVTGTRTGCAIPLSYAEKTIDATSDRSTFHLDDVPPCCPEDEPTYRRFLKAELCVAGSAICGFLVASGATMVVLHYILESSEENSLMKQKKIGTHILGLSFVALAGVLIAGILFAYAVWKVMQVVEMAHRYQEHKEFCADEDLRQSFRSKQSPRSVVDLTRNSASVF